MVAVYDKSNCDVAHAPLAGLCGAAGLSYSRHPVEVAKISWRQSTSLRPPMGQPSFRGAKIKMNF